MQTLIMEEYEYAIPRKTGMAERLRLKFSGGGTAPAVPKPPLTSEAAGKVNADITSDGRRRSGSGSTILTGGSGVTNQTSRKTILGG